MYKIVIKKYFYYNFLIKYVGLILIDFSKFSLTRIFSLLLKIRVKTGAKNGTVVFPAHRFSLCLSRNLSAIPNYQNRINIFNALLFCRFRIRTSIFRKKRRKLIRLPHSVCEREKSYLKISKPLCRFEIFISRILYI